ncbi:MAG: serine/threonine-protein kinase [Chloroflexota bacterium]
MYLYAGASLQGSQVEYKIVREVARGGMGAIYCAEDRANNRIVAIKQACLDPACGGNIAQIRERLTYEMQALMPLDHPNIPKVYEQFSRYENEYLVMEFIEGQTLRKIQEQAPGVKRQIEQARVLGWALQVLDALAYLHAQPKPIIHRDLKPENMILALDGRVVLVDFGLMKQVERQLESGPLIHAIGTIEFAPPEQYAESGGHTDQRTDIYSLGAMLYSLLAGHLPPRAVDRMLPMSMSAPLKRGALRQANSTVSPHVEEIIFKAMEIEPEKRYQSARAMREAICPQRKFIPLPF